MIRVERDGRVVTWTIDNPPRNFLDRPLVLELDRLTRAVARDPSVGAVVLTGAHPDAFVAHYDVAEILAGAELTPALPAPVLGAAIRVVGAVTRVPGAGRVLRRSRLAGLVTLWHVHRMYERMNRADKVFIAAINGFTVAGGFELALACDIRLIADGDFGVGVIEPLVGLHPGGSGGQRLARAVGPARALELLVEGRVLSPREAEEAGLVHRVVPAERLREEAQATAARLAQRSPAAIWAAKRAVYRGFSRRWGAALQLDRSGFVYAAVQPSAKAAMRVFLEQLDALPPEAPSPWAQERTLRSWQDGSAQLRPAP